MGGFFEVVRAQDATAQARATQAENSARWGVSQHVLDTRGSTSVRRQQPIMFETPFLSPPFVSTGAVIKKDFSPEVAWVPETNAGVWQWHRNTRGHYTGAYVFLMVKTPQVQAEIEHHFTFSGVAYKDLGEQVSTDAQLLQSRPVGFGGA